MLKVWALRDTDVRWGQGLGIVMNFFTEEITSTQAKCCGFVEGGSCKCD